MNAAIITARAGSKSIADKNVYEVAGRPPAVARAAAASPFRHRDSEGRDGPSLPLGRFPALRRFRPSPRLVAGWRTLRGSDGDEAVVGSEHKALIGHRRGGDETTLECSELGDVFLAAFDDAGTFQWVRRITSSDAFMTFPPPFSGA